jgi:hypothetical protein
MSDVFQDIHRMPAEFFDVGDDFAFAHRDACEAGFPHNSIQQP